MYSEVHKSETKTIPYHTTDNGELYAMSTKAVDKDTLNETPLIYTYAMVDTERVRKQNNLLLDITNIAKCVATLQIHTYIEYGSTANVTY